MTQEKKIVNELKRWLKKNSPAYLAWKLGYKSTQVIENWVTRGKVPHYMSGRLEEILNERVSRTG